MVRDAVIAKSDYNYKTNFEIWRENQDLSAKILQVVDHLWNRLLLVEKPQDQKYYLRDRLLLVQNIRLQNTNKGLVRIHRI